MKSAVTHSERIESTNQSSNSYSCLDSSPEKKTSNFGADPFNIDLIYFPRSRAILLLSGDSARQDCGFNTELFAV